jgi:hypothetical protein
MKEEMVENGIYVVTHNTNWNKLGLSLAVYANGRFYDQFVVEDEQLSIGEWDITDKVTSFNFTGHTYNEHF